MKAAVATWMAWLSWHLADLADRLDPRAANEEIDRLWGKWADEVGHPLDISEPRE